MTVGILALAKKQLSDFKREKRTTVWQESYESTDNFVRAIGLHLNKAYAYQLGCRAKSQISNEKSSQKPSSRPSMRNSY